MFSCPGQMSPGSEPYGWCSEGIDLWVLNPCLQRWQEFLFFVELACYKELEKEIATHSGNLAWRIPWTEEPGRLQSMGLQRVRHDWATITQRTEGHPCKCLLASLSSVHTTQWVFQTIKIWLLTFWLTRTYWLFGLILRLKARHGLVFNVS